MAQADEESQFVARQEARETNTLLGRHPQRLGGHGHLCDVVRREGRFRKAAAFVAFPLVIAAGLLVIVYHCASGRGAVAVTSLHDQQVISRVGFKDNALLSDRNSENRTAGSTPLGLLREYLLAVTTLTYGCKDAERVGSRHDGGYVWCNDVAPHPGTPCTLFGYGIADDDSFEQEAAGWGCQVHEFDPTVEPTEGSRMLPQMIHFHKEGGADKPGVIKGLGVVDSIENHYHRFFQPQGNGSWLALKLDIEEAEWLTLAAVPDWLYEKVDLLIVEFHSIAKDEKLLADMASRVALLKRLKEIFYVYHVHANNWGTTEFLPSSRWNYASQRPFPDPDTPGFFIPAYAELSFLRKSRIPEKPQGPFPERYDLDHRNAVNFPPVQLNLETFPLPPADS